MYKVLRWASYLKVTTRSRVERGLIRRLESRREVARATGSTRAGRGRVVSGRIARATVSVGRFRVASTSCIIENRQLLVASASVARVLQRVCVLRRRFTAASVIRPFVRSFVHSLRRMSSRPIPYTYPCRCLPNCNS